MATKRCPRCKRVVPEAEMLGAQCRKCYEEIRSADAARGEGGAGLAPKKVLGTKASVLIWGGIFTAAVLGGFGAQCSSRKAVSGGNGIMAALMLALVFAYRSGGVARRVAQAIFAILAAFFIYLAIRPGPSMGAYEVVGDILEAILDD